jgi:hypothetical protein
MTQRSRAAADSVVRDIRLQIVATSDSDTIKQLLTEDLVDAVLEEAWKDQFEDDRTHFIRRVREIVEDAVEQALLDRTD